MVAPLISLTGKEDTWEWRPAWQKGFECVMSLLIHARVWRLPDVDRPFIVVTDASNYGISRVMLHESHPLALESRKLNSEELKYTTTKIELLVIVNVLRTWRSYLESCEFTVVTDHNPLVFFRPKQHLSCKQAQWS